ncbi:MAG TPA: phospholipase D-like domain-containing protein [Actinophytocola sp.]|uniref:phospholipase D-like domain-containing protein n=1 Tax=Actinophytocola sp. TaxID=1872138 RepID=UPI002DBAA45A|nr:phospholipase D-like domain-containing protein [Actinophytocola sp.]HEU5471242.1 phospholipase D-like domain-containing protein [Actinophytocola sp.]
MRRVLLAGLVSVLAMLPGPVPSAAAPAAIWADPCQMLGTAKVVSCFSDPLTGPDVSSRIVQSLGALVASARPGDTIKIMMYHWRDGVWPERLAAEVVAAYRAGVHVEVMLDEQSRGFRPIATLRAAGVPLLVCDDEEGAADGQDDCVMVEDGPYGDNEHLPMNHGKLFLFELGGVPVVAAGSSNLTAWDYETAWNDFVRIRGDRALHTFFTEFFDRAWADDWMGWDTNAERDRAGDPVSGGDLPERGWVYPRLEPGDPIAGQLANTTACHADGDGDGDWDKRVWVAISIWNENTRTGILDELDRLDAAGCSVRVLIADGVSRPWLQTLRQRLSGDPAASDKVRVVCHLHHKFIVIDARYDGAYREVVLTGSHIYATGSLRNSVELNVRVGGNDNVDNGVVVDYINRFQRLYDYAPTDACD